MKRINELSVRAVFLFFLSLPLAVYQQRPAVRTDKPESAGRPVVIYGDTRNGHEVHRKIISRIIKLNPEAVFHTGDLVFSGKCNKNWETFNSIIAPLAAIAPVYASIGNHELGQLRIDQQMKMPNDGKWYSVDIQKMHFIVLDAEEDYRAGSEQYQWLQRDLENQPPATRFTVVIDHYPFYTTGPHKSHIKRLRGELIPLFEKYGVDMVFSGHNHCYERSFTGGIYYIVTAGGGAPLYGQVKKGAESQLYIKEYNYCVLETGNDTLFVNAMDTAMRRIDRFFVVAGK